MALSVARMFQKGLSTSLGAFATRSFPTPFRSYCVGMFDKMDYRPEQFTPVAWESLKLAKEIAIELNQVYIYPECVVLSLLDLKESIAKDVLVNANCDLKSLEQKLLFVLKQEQKKTTDLQYMHAARMYATKKYYRMLEKIGYYPYPYPEDSYLDRENREPKCALSPLMLKAKIEMRGMGDKLIGEEHFLLAYQRDQMYGRQVFGELNVRRRFIISEARAIRASLKKNDLDKADEKQGEEEKPARGENMDEGKTKKH